MRKIITSSLLLLGAVSTVAEAQSFGDQIAAANAEPLFWEWSDCLDEVYWYASDEMEDGRLEMEDFHRVEIEDAKCEAGFATKLQQLMWAVDNEILFADLLQGKYDAIQKTRDDIRMIVAHGMQKGGWDEVEPRGSRRGRAARASAEQQSVTDPLPEP